MPSSPQVPLIGYGPDLDSTIPGILTNCSAFIPSLKGMEAAPRSQNSVLPAIAGASRGAAVLQKSDNTTRFFSGSSTKLYEAISSNTWTDVSFGSSYALGTTDLWRFAQFGDEHLAAAKSNILQSATAGAFANATTSAPRASIVEVVNGFILLGDVNDQGSIYDSADRPNGWWAARTSDVWTPSVANEAYTGTLTSTPGKLRAIRRFGTYAIAYKDRSMYQGIYVGQSGWQFDQIPGDTGAMSQEVVVDVGTIENPLHVFMGFDDFYIYDGSRPISVGTPLSKTVFGELNKQYSFTCRALHDRINKRVYFYYPVGSSLLPDRCVVFNYRTKQWGRDDRSIEAAIEYISAGLSYDNLGTLYGTYDALPSVSYDSAFWSSGYPIPAIINSLHVVQTLDGPAGMSSMTTGDYGADENLTLLERVQPRFLSMPDSATMTNYYRDALGNDMTTDQTVVMDDKGRFDVYRTANWHRATFAFDGTTVIPSLRADLTADGLE